MDIRKVLIKITAQHGLSVGFGAAKRIALTEMQKEKFREEVENSVDATYRGAPMAMAQGEVPSGIARVSISSLLRIISDFELVPDKLENATRDIVDGAARMPCIRYDDRDASVVIEQGRHRIAAMHGLSYSHTMLNYPAGQLEKLQAILGSDFVSS